MATARKAAEPERPAEGATEEVPASPPDATIHARIVAIMAEIRGLGKHQRVDTGPAKFAFRGIDSVMNAVGPACRRHGVFVTSEIVSVDYASVRTSGDKPSGATRLVINYTFRDVNGGEVSTMVAAEAWDSGDRATQKAMSIGLRTCLLQMLILPTDETDPEQDSYERADYNHPRVMDQLRTAKTKEQAQAIWRRAQSSGASQEQLAEVAEIGSQLPEATQGIRTMPGPEEGPDSAAHDVAANDLALDRRPDQAAATAHPQDGGQ